MKKNKIYNTDALNFFRQMPDEFIDSIVTSPPYFNQRDYGGVDGQIGLEQSVSDYVGALVEIFDEAKRCLKPDGSIWVNIGDSYAGSGKGRWKDGSAVDYGKQATSDSTKGKLSRDKSNLPAKNLLLVPFHFTIAMQVSGWIVRSVVIWHKVNPMPHPVKDRPVTGHEYIIQLAKNRRYYYGFDDVQVPVLETSKTQMKRGATDDRKYNDDIFTQKINRSRDIDFNRDVPDTRNIRTVWSMSTGSKFKSKHIAPYPEELAERMVLASTPIEGIVCDPFAGSGTTLEVAIKNNRHYIGCELNPEYAKIAEVRIEEFNKGKY